MTYYTQAQTQSDALEGYLGVLLFDSSGRVAGFVPESESVKDLTIGSASASTLTDSSGVSYRIASGAVACPEEAPILQHQRVSPAQRPEGKIRAAVLR